MTAQVDSTLVDSESKQGGRRLEDERRLTNTSSSIVDTHLLVIVQGLPAEVQLVNASGMTSSGEPYIRLFLTDGVLNPGQQTDVTLRFTRPRNAPVNYTLKLLFVHHNG